MLSVVLRENRDGILVEQSAYPDDDAYSYGDELEHLIEAAQRIGVLTFIKLRYGVQHALRALRRRGVV